MNTIFSKLGIYDLVAVLLSGISVSTISLLVSQIEYDKPLEATMQVKETLLFLVISYIVGLILQELGSWLLNECLHKNNGLLKDSLKTADDSHTQLTPVEKNGVYSYVMDKLGLKTENDNVIYNYCKFCVVNKCDTTRIDKDQSIAAMSRSLALYFFILAIVVCFTIPCQPSLSRLLLVVISAFLSWLMYQRCIRFTKMRYIYIFRTFYYQVVAKYSTSNGNSTLKKEKISTVRIKKK